MAYNGMTPRGNPVSASLHKEYTDHKIEASTNGTEPYSTYDDWYENVKKNKTASNIYVNPQPQ